MLVLVQTLTDINPDTAIESYTMNITTLEVRGWSKLDLALLWGHFNGGGRIKSSNQGSHSA